MSMFLTGKKWVGRPCIPPLPMDDNNDDDNIQTTAMSNEQRDLYRMDTHTQTHTQSSAAHGHKHNNNKSE